MTKSSGLPGKRKQVCVGLELGDFPQSEKISVVIELDKLLTIGIKVQLSFTSDEAIKCLKSGVCGHWEFQKMGAKEANLL